MKKNGVGVFCLSLVFLCSKSFASEILEPSQNVQWPEVQAIIDTIKTQNPPDSFKLQIKTGLIQMTTNQSDGIALGAGGNTVGIGIEGIFSVFEKLGIEAREMYSQNLLSDKTSINKSSAYASWANMGLRYTFLLDSTKLDNNIVIKLLYHENYNNFLLNPGHEGNFWVNYYSGASAAFERNIPITTKLGLTGMFDIIQILNASSPSLNLTNPANPTKNIISKTGYGFEILLEAYYKTLMGRWPVRMGLCYWQQGHQNELDESLKQSSQSNGKNSYVQNARALFATLAVLF